jgi:lipopolysaccharide/colanic/teichoic acid biosynthesis glycosyltransferase
VQTTQVEGATSSAVESLQWNLPGSLVWGQQKKHFQMAFKRVVDVAVASSLLLLLAVPLVIVAIMVKLDSPGPVFYPHDRIGHHGRKFRMFKFRSMFVDAEKAKAGLLSQNETDAPLFKMKHDPRRTRVGNLIRRFSIDEFPQLINVVQGHMSLVGPRPALPEEAAAYSDYHAHRVIAVPGMTGLWQVSGRSLLPFEQMVELDVRYARDWSVWLDIFIIVKTIPVILGGKGAY